MKALTLKLDELAAFQRVAGKTALADRFQDAADMLREAEEVIRDLPVIIFDHPGQRCIVLPQQSAEYARRIGVWMRRRDNLLERKPR